MKWIGLRKVMARLKAQRRTDRDLLLEETAELDLLQRSKGNKFINCTVLPGIIRNRSYLRRGTCVVCYADNMCLRAWDDGLICPNCDRPEYEWHGFRGVDEICAGCGRLFDGQETRFRIAELVYVGHCCFAKTDAELGVLPPYFLPGEDDSHFRPAHQTDVFLQCEHCGYVFNEMDLRWWHYYGSGQVCDSCKRRHD